MLGEIPYNVAPQWGWPHDLETVINAVEFLESQGEKESVGTTIDVKSRGSMGMLEGIEAVAKDEEANDSTIKSDTDKQDDEVNDDIANDNVTSNNSDEAEPPLAIMKLKMLVS